MKRICGVVQKGAWKFSEREWRVVEEGKEKEANEWNRVKGAVYFEKFFFGEIFWCVKNHKNRTQEKVSVSSFTDPSEILFFCFCSFVWQLAFVYLARLSCAVGFVKGNLLAICGGGVFFSKIFSVNCMWGNRFREPSFFSFFSRIFVVV